MSYQASGVRGSTSFATKPPKIQIYDNDADSARYSPNYNGTSYSPNLSSYSYSREHSTADRLRSPRSSPGARAVDELQNSFQNAKLSLGRDDFRVETGSWANSPTAYSCSSPSIPSFRVSAPESPEAIHMPSPSNNGRDEMESLRMQLRTSNGKLADAVKEINDGKRAEKELQELRKEARIALSEMAEQNKQLVEAYSEKKAAVQKLEQKLQQLERTYKSNQGSAASYEPGCKEKELERRLQVALDEIRGLKARLKSTGNAASDDMHLLLQRAREETDELRMVNHRQAREIDSLKERLDEQNEEMRIAGSFGGLKKSTRVGRRGNPSVKIGRCITAKTRKINELDAKNAELKEQNDKIRREHAEIVERAQRREDAESAKHEATCSFQKSEYKEAIEAYSTAIACNVEDDKYNAVLYLNRAACHQALKDYLKCIADCCAAASLDPTMPKTYHRRADAYQSIRDYSSAYNDMVILKERLGKGCEVDDRLRKLKELANSHSRVDHCLVLGVSQKASERDVKLAYKRLSLVHHPDKVPSKERPGAEIIFKILCEAHRVLSAEAAT